jgi:MbtH protein
MTERLKRLLAALWFGSAAFVMLAASAAFRVAPTPVVAADVVGALLTRWHYIALIVPLVLFALELRRVRFGVLVLLFIAIVFASMQGFADVRIRSIRASSDIPISYLSRRNPLRREFGVLHGISSGLLLLQALVAAAVVMSKPREEEEEVMEDNGIYKVVINDEEQYSIWPADRENALGWRDAGKEGTKQECLDYIKQVWTDMRPESVRDQIED